MALRSGLCHSSKWTLSRGLTHRLAMAMQVFGRTPDGQMGYLDDMTSERVDAGGMSNIAKLAQRLPKQQTDSAQILSMGSANDLKVLSACCACWQCTCTEPCAMLLTATC